MTGLSQAELTVVLLGLCTIALFGTRAFVKWVLSGPVQPDPWDKLVSTDFDDTSSPLCHECLLPYESHLHFCRNCGAMVGECTSWMPPLYFYSMGHVFWTGTNGKVRPSPVIIAGFMLFASTAYVLMAPLFILAPIYWFKFFRNLRQAAAPPPASGGQDAPPVIATP